MPSRELATLLTYVTLLFGCHSTDQPIPAPHGALSPYVLVLGSAQDGGYPQIACQEALCQKARAHPSSARFPSSIELNDPASARRWLFDAGPRLPEQLELARLLRGLGPGQQEAGRPALWDGIFLTHAHFGHIAGLAWLGREVYAAEGQRLFGSAPMLSHLLNTPPYDLYAAQGHFTFCELSPDQPLQLSPGLSVECLRVPHRAEWSDTLAFLLRGPRRSLLYLPDIDKWERWERPLEALLAQVDYALIDGTFYNEGEIPGRQLADIPHPFIVESLARLAVLPLHERAKVYFTHLNHSNPCSDPASEASARVQAAGMHIAREGMRFELGSAQ